MFWLNLILPRRFWYNKSKIQAFPAKLCIADRRYLTDNQKRLQPEAELGTNNIKKTKQRNITINKNNKREKLHMNPLHRYDISRTSTVNNTRKHEDNTELGTILLEGGGNDPKLDHDSDNPQVKANQGECMTKGECMADPTHTDLINSHTIAPTNLDASNKEDQLQSNMNIKRRQEESKENLTTASKQEEDPYSAQQSTEQRISEQPTLHSVGNPTYCIGERANLGNGTSAHGPRSLGPRTLLTVLREATNPVTRTPARQICNIADT
ncbi:uncharacterized protein LOC130799684 isoform X2 [Amaranthus tricolor]|uniref:uncharacterized protein LOC130799684 isoform X2 n=1 Tax=Amaranthus tricolor TaxID=29722 RepID=UPI00258692EB|nr:uncharacterized protein LOC130799684 isoform X2 [Amaranthus tricolor]